MLTTVPSKLEWIFYEYFCIPLQLTTTRKWVIRVLIRAQVDVHKAY